MRRKLTDKQTRLLAYLQRAIAREGQAPSLRQAASDLGVSHAAVAQSLRILEDKGYVKREGRYSRTIHILNRARETAGHHRWREIPVVGQVTAGSVVYDAETTSGGSGGPVVSLRGEVVAVNMAILPEFGGSNLGVPAHRARALLDRARSRVPEGEQRPEDSR